MPESESTTLDKYHEIELQHLFEGMMSTQSLRVQSGIFFGTVNLGALGIAFTLKSAGIIFLASGLVMGIVVIDLFAKRQLLYIYYRTAQLRMKFAPQDSESFFPQAGWVKVIDRDVLRLIEKHEGESRIKDIDRLFFRKHIVASPASIMIPVSLGIAQLLLGLYLWLAFSWSLF